MYRDRRQIQTPNSAQLATGTTAAAPDNLKFLTPELRTWVTQLMPLLEIYDYDTEGIVQLVENNDFDSAKIQNAVNLIYEEKRGREADQWKTVGRKGKVIKPLNPSAIVELQRNIAGNQTRNNQRNGNDNRRNYQSSLGSGNRSNGAFNSRFRGVTYQVRQEQSQQDSNRRKNWDNATLSSSSSSSSSSTDVAAKVEGKNIKNVILYY